MTWQPDAENYFRSPLTITAAKKQNDSVQLSSPFGVQGTIAKFSVQAVWLDSDLEMKSHLVKMCDAIAASFGKSRLTYPLTI